MKSLNDYMRYRHLLDTGDKIEWRSNTVLGWLIRLRTGANVNHTSMVVKFDFDGCRERRYVLEALNGGIELRLLSRRLEKFHGKAWWAPLQPRYAMYRSRLLGSALDAVGTEYDYGSLLRQLVGKVSVQAEKYFCSEFLQHKFECAEIVTPLSYAIQPGGFDEAWPGVFGPEVEIL